MLNKSRLFASLRQNLIFSIPVFLGCLLFIWLIQCHVLTSALLIPLALLFSCALALPIAALESRICRLQEELRHQLDPNPLEPYESKIESAASNAIHWLSQFIFEKRDLKDLLPIALDVVRKVLEADDASLMLLDDKQELYIAANSGLSQEVVDRTHLKIGERVAGRVAQLKEPFLILGGLKNYPEFKDLEENSKIGSSIVCPLLYHDQLVGIFNLNRESGGENFMQLDLKYAMIFASQLAQAILNARNTAGSSSLPR